MWVGLGLVGLLLAGVLVWLALLDGNYRVSRSLDIDAPLPRVFAAVVDFRTWPEWSPWLLHEPDARVEFSEHPEREGGYFSWDGERIGAGKLTHESIVDGKRILGRIEFIRPFRSVSTVRWEFEPAGERTRVTWQMEGRMPFLLRFMTRRIEPMVGRDYDLGLALLNGYLNAETAHPRINFVGEETLEDFSYWAVPSRGTLRQLEAARKPAIEALRVAARGRSGLPLTLYRNLDPLQPGYDAEIALPIADTTPDSNYTRRRFSGGRYFRLDIRGSHEFLPLGWYALASHVRMLGIKPDGGRRALEIYHDDPATTVDSNEILTALYLPIR